jgi:DNA-binding MarR family transcriptional regulator
VESFWYGGGVNGPPTAALNHVDWASDLIRLEITLWDRVEARLRERHDLSLPFFESLHFIARATDGGFRVGDLAKALGVTVGGTSKLVDRVEAAGLIARSADPDDRRASRLTITGAGKRKLTAAVVTYQEEVAALLDPALGSSEQRQLHAYITRVLTVAREGDTR